MKSIMLSEINQRGETDIELSYSFVDNDIKIQYGNNISGHFCGDQGSLALAPG